MKTLRLILLSLFCVFLMGCAAAQIALEKKDLKVETKMSDTIFLDVEARTEKTVFMDIRNTSDKDIDLGPMLISQLQARGYRVSDNPREAFYILQGNILYFGEASLSATRQSLYAGYGGTVAGMAAGAMIGGATNRWSGVGYGAGIGGLIGAGVELIAGSLVKDVTYTIVTDLMISEKSQEQVEQVISSDLRQGSGSKIQQTSETRVQRKRYQTRIVSTANKVNLQFGEALPALQDGLARSIAGIF